MDNHYARSDEFLEDVPNEWDARDQNVRLTLAHTPTGLVERSEVAHHRAPSGYERHYQVALPLFGYFEYRTGRRSNFCDPNTNLFVTPDREFADIHPIRNLGHGSVLITPSENVLDELCGAGGAAAHAAFVTVTQPSSSRIKLLAQQLLMLQSSVVEALSHDEQLIFLLSEVLSSPQRRPARDTKVIRRAKEVLHAHPNQVLSLEDVARQVGISAVYLTQEFSRSEGLPLYRYQKQLRLSRALRELPHCEDITALALDLGFSSHSHFTFAFRKEFGLTPSQYRERRQTGRSAIAWQGLPFRRFS